MLKYLELYFLNQRWWLIFTQLAHWCFAWALTVIIITGPWLDPHTRLCHVPVQDNSECMLFLCPMFIANSSLLRVTNKVLLYVQSKLRLFRIPNPKFPPFHGWDESLVWLHLWLSVVWPLVWQAHGHESTQPSHNYCIITITTVAQGWPGCQGPVIPAPSFVNRPGTNQHLNKNISEPLSTLCQEQIESLSYHISDTFQIQWLTWTDYWPLESASCWQHSPLNLSLVNQQMQTLLWIRLVTGLIYAWLSLLFTYRLVPEDIKAYHWPFDGHTRKNQMTVHNVNPTRRLNFPSSPLIFTNFLARCWVRWSRPATSHCLSRTSSTSSWWTSSFSGPSCSSRWLQVTLITANPSSSHWMSSFQSPFI